MLELPMTVIIAAVFTLCATRFGLLSLGALLASFNMLTGAPLPLSRGAPYFTSGLIMLLVALGIALYAFRISLGARPLFAAMED